MSRAERDEARGAASGPEILLRLFVAPDEVNSEQTRRAVVELVETRLASRARLEVVDVYADYQAALDSHVIAVPTLIAQVAGQQRMLVGKQTDPEDIAEKLGLAERGMTSE